ncbi:MAG: RDD family protein, partial [Vicinamibacterales bacterium]
PARPPLAVRRATPEIPRGRSRTSARPVKTSALLGLDGPADAAPRAAVAETAVTLDPPALGARVGADAIDALLLVSIDAAVLILTLRIAGLSMTMADLRVVPPIPFVGFLVLLAIVYFAAFTVAGGQTIGKMLMGIKVIGDDGRTVDAAGGVLRALGCALVPLTLGLSYVPVFMTADRRALHDRLAGTRVVSR